MVCGNIEKSIGGGQMSGQYSKTRIETPLCQIKGPFIGGLV